MSPRTLGRTLACCAKLTQEHYGGKSDSVSISLEAALSYLVWL